MEKKSLSDILSNILKKCDKEKRGYAKYILNENGVLIHQGKHKSFDKEYYAMYFDGSQHHFLSRINDKVSFDYTDKNEIKRICLLVENTKERECAYVSAQTDINNKVTFAELINEQKFSDILDSTADKKYLFLITFDKEHEITSMHIFSTDIPPLSIFMFAIKGNPPMSEMKDFFTIMFSILSRDLLDNENHLQFIKAQYEEMIDYEEKENEQV